MGLHWGDIPSEVSAVSTIFALGFASVAAIATRRTFKIESERDRITSAERREQEKFARRAQAAMVSAWWGMSEDGKRWGAFVRNASEAPVYQAYLVILGLDNRTPALKLHLSSIPPSGEARFLPIDLPAGLSQLRPDARRVQLSFTDSAGVRWTRNSYGRLTEMKPMLRLRGEKERATVLDQFKEDFFAAYGVTVTFEADPHEMPQRELVAAIEAESPSPDAILAPHDWIGDLVERDIVTPTLLSPDHEAMIAVWARKAMTFHGELYGIPVTTDAVALIRNTDLAPQIPASFEDLVSSGQALQDAGQVTEVLALRVGHEGNPFQIWPLFTSAGGWLFGRTPDGGWDPARIGIASPESIAAFERLRSLGEAGIGVLRRSIDRTVAFELFNTGRAAYQISTSDGLREARRAGRNVAVSAVPPFADGVAATGFSLVHGLLMVKRGLNSAIAHDLFAEYLTHEHFVTVLSTSIASPIALQSSTAQDPAIRVFQEQCETGFPMPSFPQMEHVWRILSEAEAEIISGASAEATATKAADRLRVVLDE